MKYQFYLGIDVGKYFFDCALIDEEGTIHYQGQIENKAKTIQAWMVELQH